MEDYMDYFNCGVIIVASSISYKHQYLLKCEKCHEYFSVFDVFINHHQQLHYDQVDTEIEIKDEDDELCSLLQQNEECGTLLSDQQCDESQNYEDSQIETYSNVSSPLPSVKDVYQSPEEPDAKLLQDSPSQNDKADNVRVDPLNEPSPEQKDSGVSNTIEDNGEISESGDEDPLNEPSPEQKKDSGVSNTIEDNGEISESGDEWEPEDEKTRIFIRDFIKPEEHLMVLIDAYEKQPRLWNTKLYPNKLRTYKDNAQYLEEIAVELKSKLDINMPLTYNIVGAIILRMRSEYGVKLNRLRVNEQRGGTLKSRNMPDWYFEKMKFLEPFMDNYTLVQIGSHHLQPAEIVHILRIYERFPFLWNTTLPEYVCKNKHTEALKEMVNVLKSEMNIQVDEEVLKKYLYCVHGHYNTEKLIYENKRSLKKDSSLFYEHMKFLDGHVGPIYCPFAKCNRRVINPLFLKVHGNVVHELEPLRCPICDKIFTDVQRYKFHVRRHMGDSSETCKICGKQFVRTAEFKAHMRGHLGIRNYCCEICGASYSMPSSLLEHRKTHDERNKSQCQICFKIFVTKKRLTKHIRTTHTDIRNFDCTICGKAFKTKKTLKAHITIHEEGRNHPCPLCGKMFKNKIGVHHHLRTHRSNKEIKENPFMES